MFNENCSLNGVLILTPAINRRKPHLLSSQIKSNTNPTKIKSKINFSANLVKSLTKEIRKSENEFNLFWFYSNHRPSFFDRYVIQHKFSCHKEYSAEWTKSKFSLNIFQCSRLIFNLISSVSDFFF